MSGIGRPAAVNKTIDGGEDLLRIQFPENILLCEQIQQGFPVLLVDPYQDIFPGGFKEVAAMPLKHQILVSNL